MRELSNSPRLDAMKGLLSPQLRDSTKFNSDYLSHYVSNPRKGIAMIRVLAVTGCALFCYLLLTSIGTHSDWNYLTPSAAANTTNGNIHPSIPMPSSKTKADIQKELVGSLKNTGKPLYYTIHTNEPYDIESALRDVLNLVPDEIYVRELTTPITSGGEERLHEIGLRVRMFKKYFDAWEALHVVTDGLSNTAFVRDDILRYIRDTKNISTITDLPRPEAMRQYEAYRTFLSDMSTILFPYTSPYFSDHMTLHGHMYNAGQGIVMSGNDGQASFIMTAIASFRALGCELPVEIMYLGENDLSRDFREQLESLPNVVTRDLKQMVADQGWEMQGWAGKAFAAFMSSFREVILMDADVLFFSDPAKMFEESGYVDTGALFFKDRTVWPNEKRQFLRKIMPKPISANVMASPWWTQESGEYQESGVVVVDKWRHFLSVFLTTRLNGPDRSDSAAGKGTYSFWWGDKETWWIGFELAGDTDYHFHQGEVGNMGEITNVQSKDKPKTQEQAMSPNEDGTLGISTSTGPNDNIKMNVLDTAAIEKEQREKKEIESKVSIQSNVLEGEQSQGEGETSSPAIENALTFLGESSTPAGDNAISRRHLSRRDDWLSDSLDPAKRRNYTTTEFLEMPNVDYILCSPQLLHLSLDGRPLWFNGWLQANKHEPSSAIMNFEAFLIQKKRDDMVGEWAIGANNLCCLKSDNPSVFTEEERKTLDIIVDIAKGNGALRNAEDMHKDDH